MKSRNMENHSQGAIMGPNHGTGSTALAIFQKWYRLASTAVNLWLSHHLHCRSRTHNQFLSLTDLRIKRNYNQGIATEVEVSPAPDWDKILDLAWAWYHNGTDLSVGESYERLSIIHTLEKCNLLLVEWPGWFPNMPEFFYALSIKRWGLCPISRNLGGLASAQT